MKCRKIDDVTVLTARDITRIVSLETILRAAVDVSRRLLHADWDTIPTVLENYFPSAKLWLKDIYGDGKVVTETTVDNGTLTTPIVADNEVLGSLSVRLPEWFEIDEEIIDAFEGLAADVATAVIMSRSYDLIIKSIANLREAINSFSVLVDGIRNPLTAIQCLAEIKVDEEISAKIKCEVERVVELIRRIEKSWEDLEKAEKELRSALKNYLLLK